MMRKAGVGEYQCHNDQVAGGEGGDRTIDGVEDVRSNIPHLLPLFVCHFSSLCSTIGTGLPTRA